MFSIRAFVGPNGGGKTLAMTELLAVPALREGRPVVANYVVRPEAVGADPGLYRPLESWTQIPDLSGCVLLLDEITAVLPSRQAMSLPPQLARVLNQLRKADVVLGWTAPDFSRCDVILREVTQAVTLCAGMIPDRYHRDTSTPRRFPKALRDEDGNRRRIEDGWPPNRLFRWETFDAQAFDDFTKNTASRSKPQRRQWYWRTSHRAHEAYDTGEPVMLLDHLDDVGTCVVCGGKRPARKCRCPEGGAPPQAGAARTGTNPADRSHVCDEVPS